MIDIHSHILPGIDDGARTLAESVELVRELYQQGVTDIIATPHYIEETIFTSPRVDNANLLVALKQKLVEEGIKARIYLGNEIYINGNVAELIEAGEISTLADSKYLLLEIPMNGEYPNYEDFLGDLMERGYKVILAHPERYSIVQENYEIAQNLREMGILFQCNLGSIVGKYGKEVQKLVKKLAKDKMIFTFGTDTHHLGRNSYLGLAKKKLLKYYTEDELKQLLIKNPAQILLG